MEKKKFEKILKIIEQNELINTLYKRLSELEIDHASTEEMEETKDLIRNISNKADKMLRNSNFTEDDIDEFAELVLEIEDKEDEDEYEHELDLLSSTFAYREPYQNIKYKRFLSHCSEEFLIKHKFIDEPEDEPVTINIAGEEYPYDSAIEILEESGYYDYAEMVKNKFEKLNAPKTDEEIIIEDEVKLLQMQLDYHAMMAYTLRFLENMPDCELRCNLIFYKYNLLATHRCIESTFLRGENFQEKANKINNEYLSYRNKGVAVEEYYQELSKTISKMMDDIIERNKNIYEDNDDLFDDVVKMIRMNSLYVVITNSEMKKELIEEQEIATEIAAGKMDKNFLSSLFDKKLKKDLSKN